MAYATTNPPQMLTQCIGDPAATPAFWVYASTDAATVVRVSGYITNAKKLGLKAGDLVFSIKTDASPLSMQIHIVSAISATTGAADLSDGLAITATNTD